MSATFCNAVLALNDAPTPENVRRYLAASQMLDLNPNLLSAGDTARGESPREDAAGQGEQQPEYRSIDGLPTPSEIVASDGAGETSVRPRHAT